MGSYSFSVIYLQVIHIPSSNVSLYDEEPHCFSNSVKELRRQGKAISQESSYSTDTSEGSNYSDYFPLKVRGGALRRPAGYQVFYLPAKFIFFSKF